VTVIEPFLLLFLAVIICVILFFIVRTTSGFMTVARWVGGIFLAITFFFFLYREWYRRRDIWAVTNLRVIDEKGIISLFSKESPLEKINNLSYYQSLLGRILHYGDVEIQTAAEDGATIYKKVTNPRLLKDTIARCRDEYSRGVMRMGKPAPPDSADKKPA
jgi:membrane protein YdbS with pleckstrin-like domain